MIVSGGENVYAIELEQVLAQHPHVLDVVVSGVDDPVYGSRLTATIQLKTGVMADEAHIRQWISANAARYHMPREIDFVESIQYNSLGKVAKRKV
jgi:fatty-acyl-CoA synthase